ncbi:hypothetical protein BDC45DRAFT_509376 [Circinella umbellata]|nr:hypothetical protein BDC45DRAFT_509376 [Circinella umbellata]
MYTHTHTHIHPFSLGISYPSLFTNPILKGKIAALAPTIFFFSLHHLPPPRL